MSAFARRIGPLFGRGRARAFFKFTFDRESIALNTTDTLFAFVAITSQSL